MTNEDAKALVAIMVEAAAALADPTMPHPTQAPDIALRLLNAAKALSDAMPDETDPEPPLPF